VSITDAPELEVVVEGQCIDGVADETHPGVALAVTLLGHNRFRYHIHSDIPLARGLGSSASLALATAAAAGVDDPLSVAIEFDGHAENAAASFTGGLVAAARIDDRPVVVTYAIDPELQFVAVIPAFHLSTHDARAVLPDPVARADALANLARVPLLIAGLCDHSYLIPSLFEDRLHQPWRSSLHPHAESIMAAMLEGGALGACWSGAGPTLLAITTQEAAESLVVHLRASLGGLEATVEVLEVDVAGLVVTDD
jgi:homoserine kinase